MRIGEHGIAIIMLAASSGLFAQSNDSPRGSQNPSSAPDVRQIVGSSIAATLRSWQGRVQYTYLERDEDRRLDPEGRLKSEKVDVSRMILVNGVPFEQLVERNGQPPSAEEEVKQQEKLEKLKRETPEQRDERIRKQTEDDTSVVREVSRAFDFQLVGEDVINGPPMFSKQRLAPAIRRRVSTEKCSLR
jgi:hypothetical protein